MGTLSYLLPCLFILGTAADPYDDPNTLWNRQTMVHLFEWKWTDIAAECENFLQYYGYGAVQVSPPNEHITLTQNGDVPWWIRYQPVSYKLDSRSGNEEQFKDMVNRCNKVGVRIIVDVVSNHMTGVGQKNGVAGVGSSGGSSFDGTDGVESFPEVPYSKSDFNDGKCSGNIGPEDYGSNAGNVRNCRLVGLLDLDQSKTYVRGKIIGYLNNLIDIGVAGFRFDASKHMWPEDLGAILDGMKNLRQDIFGSNKRPFVVHEVIDRGGEAVKCAEYTGIGRYTNFNYGPVVSEAVRGHLSWHKLQSLKEGYAYGNHADNDVLNFIDNHDNQRGGDVLNYKDGDAYKKAVAFMLAWSYGYPRVMSSYYFDNNDQGPPREGSYNTKSPSFNQDLTCNPSSGWVCEHRWPITREMAKFRSIVSGTPASKIMTGYKQLAFDRGGRGFFAINDYEQPWRRYFFTALPSGQYCDVWSGSLKDGRCTGRTINVNNGIVDTDVEDVIAISLASKIGGAPDPDPPGPQTQPPVQPTERPQPQPTIKPTSKPVTFPPGPPEPSYSDPYDNPHTLTNRVTMVHLFEWKWTDIAAECENFLQYYGYGAVQVSPPNEHITLTQNGDMPWWIRYQPVSYKLNSRSGNEEQFKDMVNRCNKVGVRIIVDTVMNHMTGVGQKKDVNGRGSSGGSFFDGMEGVESFPEVPYSRSDFNDGKCRGNIGGGDYGSNAGNVRNCRLVGLLDLDQSKQYVRGKLIGYLNHLIDLGVAGFRLDASKHMWPGDLGAIQGGTKNLREDIFGSNKRPFFVHEVIDRGGEAIKCAEYTGIGRYTNFNYGPVVSGAARGGVDWANLRYLQQGYGYGNHADNDVLNFIDNHDNQRGGDVLNYKHGDQYKRAVAFMLAWTYGYPRVMSSFYFNNNDQGPPSAGAGGGYATRSPSFNQDLTCNPSSGWVCEHRWPTTREMVKFRSTVAGTSASEIVTGYKQLAFARGGKGFFAINGNGGSWRKQFQTSLPSGQYCDVWSGYLKDGRCTGKTITVNNGMADIDVTDIVAISLSSKIGSGPDPPGPQTQPPAKTTPKPPPQPTGQPVTFPPGPEPSYSDGYDDPHTPWNKQTIVHLFEWKWVDIAKECKFLEQHGYGAVQVSPPNEHSRTTVKGHMPWWVRYEPLSYKIQSRSGNEQQFREMIEKCNEASIRIIVDVVVKGGASEVTGYLNNLIDMGVAGFRFDASKQSAGELRGILEGAKDLRSDIFGDSKRPFAIHEVADGETSKCGEYTDFGRCSDYNIGRAITDAAKSDWSKLASLQNALDSDDALTFVDNHINQRGGPVLNYKSFVKYELGVAFLLAWPYGIPRVMSSFFFRDGDNDRGPPVVNKRDYEIRSMTHFREDKTCDPGFGWVCEHRYVHIRNMVKFRTGAVGAPATEFVTENHRIAFALDGRGFFALNGINSTSWVRSFQTTLPEGRYCNFYAGGMIGKRCNGQTITVGSDGMAEVQVYKESAVAISLATKIGGGDPDPPGSRPTRRPRTTPTRGPSQTTTRTRYPPIPTQPPTQRPTERPTQRPTPPPTQPPTLPPVPPGYAKTVILLKRDTNVGQYVFLRGGTSHASGGACSPDQETDRCAIPIRHSTVVPPSFMEYQYWSPGDNYLDFSGPERNQGRFNNRPASGTPMVWSTNDPFALGYQKYNKYGRGFWLVELEMDCSRTENGWFELKGFLTPWPGWENDIRQGSCNGAIGGYAPFQSINHIAKCGAVNVFYWGSGGCTIDPV